VLLPSTTSPTSSKISFTYRDNIEENTEEKMVKIVSRPMGRGEAETHLCHCPVVSHTATGELLPKLLVSSQNPQPQVKNFSSFFRLFKKTKNDEEKKGKTRKKDGREGDSVF
jgi:hypothetical protein